MIGKDKYIAVAVTSGVGKGLKSRVPYFNKLIGRYGMHLIMLLKKVKFYDAKGKKVVLKDLPYLFNYAFIKVCSRVSLNDVHIALKECEAPISVLGIVIRRGVSG